MNLQFGFFGLIFCFQEKYNYVYYCICFPSFLDLIDGKIARLLSSESIIGKHLDSMSDLVSFVVVPSMLGYNKYDLIIPNSFYLLSGCYRLARFNISTSDEFEGLPTPVSCIFIMILSYLEIERYKIYFFYFLLSFLMISSFKIKKYHKNVSLCF